jgi:pre-mRNA-splicing factor ATP-dependent RNA helicase DHX16
MPEMGRHRSEKSRGESSNSSKYDDSECQNDHKSHKDRQSKHHPRRRYESDSDSDDSTEKERLRDLQERDEFADRLKEKDKEKTRNVVQPSGSGEYLPIFEVNDWDMKYTYWCGF